MAQINILLVDDESEVLAALQRVLHKLDAKIFTAGNGKEGLAVLKRQPIDIIISDLKMPEMDGNQFLKVVAQMYPNTVRIMLTGFAEINQVLLAVNEGHIWGYLQKPWNNRELLINIEQAFAHKRLLSENKTLKKVVAKYQEQHRQQFEGFIGESMLMQFVYKAIEQSAPSSASVFITGPSGAGKEVAAEAIHRLSKRSNEPFIALNCAAIPKDLMESEIFGHVKGAFSGAINNRDGAATAANGGTLFLDELAEMDINLQAKLLRFIQTGTFQKVGSSTTEHVDIRFISATNREPMEAISEGKLREDLYYRLNVISIDLPPLSQRDNDSGLIAEYFLEKFCHLENKDITGFSNEAMQTILQYDWPGNIRQLQNCVHSLVILSEESEISGDLIKQQLKLNQQPLKSSSDSSKTALTNGSQAIVSRNHIEPLATVERKVIENAIAACDENVVQAAGLLEVSPSTLYRKMQQWQD